jgi:hypothetical protein
LKVFVHAFDANGQLVCQHDSVPALWTHPASEWNVGEKVIDFHPLTVDAAQARGPITIQVGLYDAATGQRIILLDPSTAPGTDKGDGPRADSVILETVDLHNDEGEVTSRN